MPPAAQPAKPIRKPVLRPLLARSGPFAVKTAAVGVVAVPTLHATRGVVKAWAGRDDAPPVSHDVHQTSEGTYARTEDGGSAFFPSEGFLSTYGDFLDKARAAAEVGYNVGMDPMSPFVIDDPESSGQSTAKDIVGTLASPVTLLVIGAIVLGFIFLKSKTKKGA